MTRRLAKTTDRGYGWAHQQERERHRPTVDTGEAWCTEPICLVARGGGTRWIRPGTPWDLAHNRETGGYRGPAHRRCNRAEGARWKQLLRRGFRPLTPSTTPTDDRRWRL